MTSHTNEPVAFGPFHLNFAMLDSHIKTVNGDLTGTVWLGKKRDRIQSEEKYINDRLSKIATPTEEEYLLVRNKFNRV